MISIKSFFKKTNDIVIGIIVGALRGYQYALSPFLGSNCRFYPSCSEFAKETICKQGVFIGGVRTIFRVLRCNPLNKGGIDLP